jgi:hypothetical protein
MPYPLSLVERFMRLFQGNKKGHGYGRKSGVEFKPDKNKHGYKDNDARYIGWQHKTPEFTDYQNHLEGEVALGIGMLLDDGTTWRLEIDLDTADGGNKYEFDYAEEMEKLKQDKLPWVASRTKSGGIRAALLFNEPIDAVLIQKIGQQLRARHGWGNNEIFPKQAKQLKENDCPSWTFLPYGPTFGVFAEQCGMNDSGNPLTLEEFVAKAERSIISREKLLAIVGEEQQLKTEARINGKKRHGGGKWSKEENEPYLDTVRATFCDGPPCLWTIVHNRCHANQHDFLFACGTFLKRKYPDNWPEALKWVNWEVLSPKGDEQKLESIIKDLKYHQYEYRCKTEPICSHCNPYACRKMHYGVGSGNGEAEYRELGMVIWLSDPRRYIINVGDSRVSIAGEELLKLSKFRERCLTAGLPFPDMMKQPDWDKIVRAAIETATMVEPPIIMRSNINEIETLTQWFSLHIPNEVRRRGQEYLDGKGRAEEDKTDVMRVRVSEEKIYFKWEKLRWWCTRQNLSSRDVDKLRSFISDKGEYHGREGGEGGIRGWFRCTHSITFKLLDEENINKWLNPG